MVSFTKSTEFAPAKRLCPHEIMRQVKLIARTPLVCKHLDIIPDIVLILNEHRQIVFANSVAKQFMHSSEENRIYGLRPGEFFRCIHAKDSDHGCGTTAYCRNCGAVKAILAGISDEKSVEECHITPADKNTALDYRVTAAPYFFADERFVFFVMKDISHEKRREVLERIFFHDVNNTLNALFSSVQLMQKHAPDSENRLNKGIFASVHMLINEIGAQQSLLYAEDGNLMLNPKTMSSLNFLDEVLSLYSHYDCAQDRTIMMASSSEDIKFTSDKNQLSRVLGNMLKNALEAADKHETITIGCGLTRNETLRFWVHNYQYIDDSVRSRIFKRSFSTKGCGRGVGTYSMKLLGENYLKGSVSFTSAPDDGTVFSIEIPLTLVV
ncbi:MAG: PAS domain-containing sensor histidine kinase [Kiritimatiellia bacterium]